MADTIFTKIIKGEIPSNKVYEDAKTYAFLDHEPKIAGHTVIATKTQAPTVWDLPAEDYQALMKTVNKVASRIKQVLGPKWVGMQVEGISIDHAHVHVFPFNSAEEYDHHPDPAQKPSPEELSAMAAKLAF